MFDLRGETSNYFCRKNVLCCKYVLKWVLIWPSFYSKGLYSPIENILTSSPQSKIPFLQPLQIHCFVPSNFKTQNTHFVDGSICRDLFTRFLRGPTTPNICVGGATIDF